MFKSLNYDVLIWYSEMIVWLNWNCLILFFPISSAGLTDSYYTYVDLLPLFTFRFGLHFHNIIFTNTLTVAQIFCVYIFSMFFIFPHRSCVVVYTLVFHFSIFICIDSSSIKNKEFNALASTLISYKSHLLNYTS